MKTHEFRIVHVNNTINGSYYKIQQKTFWGWRTVYASGDLITQHSCFIRYEDAEAQLAWIKKLDEKGVIQKF